MINVLADKHLYRITDFAPAGFDLTLFDPAAPLKSIPDEMQALLIRTVTKINAENYPNLPEDLSFIGTGSAGTDHVDINYLEEQGITFAHAGGCNARSVAEYVTVALLLWAEEFDEPLAECTIGIVGAGHTGSAAKRLLNGLDIQMVLFDPPRAERESDFASSTINEVLSCDILTFHTPLTRTGAHPTFHWLNDEKLKNHSFKLVINASRGGVVDEQSLINAFDRDSVDNFILDVWENEPNFNDETARRAFIKTPHIAGYSVQAKERASKMIAEAMARHFRIDDSIPDINSDGKTQQSASHKKRQKQQPVPDTFWSLTDALTHYHPINDYDMRFKMLIGRNTEAKSEDFGRIRTGHPLRQEFGYLKIREELKGEFHELKVLSSN